MKAATVAVAVLAAAGCVAGEGDAVDVDDVVAGWQEDFTVRAAKTEPTFVERLAYGRMGDLFVLDASSSDGDIGRIVLRLEADGAVVALQCPVGTDCSGPWTTGFLSTVAALAAHREGRLDGDGVAVHFAGHDAVCIPAEMLGAVNPPLDPCFDRRTGAVLAHRHRSDGSLDGPTPDAESLTLAPRAEPELFARVTRTGGENP